MHLTPSLCWFWLSSENNYYGGRRRGPRGRRRCTRGRGRDPKECVGILGLGGVGGFQEWGDLWRDAGIPRGESRS